MARTDFRMPGQFLAELRIEKGFVDQASLAVAAGVSDRTIRRIESSEGSKPKSGTFRCLANGLGLTTSELVARIAAYERSGVGGGSSARAYQENQEQVAERILSLTDAKTGESLTIRDHVRETILAYNLRIDEDPEFRRVVQKARRFGEASGLLRLLDRDIEDARERLTGLHLKRAAVCIILGKAAKARKSIRQVLASSPHDVEAQLLNASLHRIEANLDVAEQTCRQVLRTADRPPQRHAALTLLGFALGDRGDCGDAEAAHSEALSIAQGTKDMTRQAAESHRLIAMMQRRQMMNRAGSEEVTKADLASSRKHWAAGLRLYRELNDQVGVLTLLDNVAIGHVSVGNLRRALSLFTKLVTKNRALRHRPGEATAHGNLCLVHGQQGHYASAIKSAQRAARIFRRIGWVENVARTHANIAQCYTLWERKGFAIKHWLKAERMFEKAGMKSPAEACAGNLRRLRGEDAETPYMA